MNIYIYWQPAVLPLQILRLGNFIILCVPSGMVAIQVFFSSLRLNVESAVLTCFLCSPPEFTTMAGRRLREAVKATLLTKGNGEFNNVTVVIAGLTNSYSQYVTTFEEYQIQRYEVFSNV
jgi:neutral ceramidase